MKLINKIGIFNPDGEILLHRGISVSWASLSDNAIPDLPFGTQLNIEISIKDHNLFSGTGGVVWATFDVRQAEILYNALRAQHIASFIGKIELDDSIILLIKVDNHKDIGDAVDFIWRKESGLRLKPDWSYPAGEPNRSFNEWLNEQ